MDCNKYSWNVTTTNATNYFSFIDSLKDTLSHRILFGFITPIIAILGIFLNAATYHIFNHSSMKSCILNWYLSVLSISDIFILISSVLSFSLSTLSLHYENFLLFNIANACVLISYPAAMIAQTWNVWLTVTVSCHRFLGVCYPFHEKRYCNRRNCRKSVIIVFLFAILFNVPRFFETTLRKCYSREINYTLIIYGPSKLRKSTLYVNAYINWCYCLIMFVIPFIALIIMNGAVLLSLKKSPFEKSATNSAVLLSLKKSPVEKGATANNGSRKSKQTVLRDGRASLVLIGVVSEFLLFNSLAFVVNIVELVDYMWSKNGDDKFTYSETYKIMIETSNAMVIVSAAVNNVIVYYALNSRFRYLFKRFFKFAIRRSNLQRSETFIMATIVQSNAEAEM